MADKPGLMTRLVSSVSYLISGIAPNTWMGPAQPLEPMAPDDVKGRQYDYGTGQNLNYRPRSTELVGFPKLRALAESSNVLRTVIERQKDLIEGFSWQIKAIPLDGESEPDATKHADDIKTVRDFLQRPDRVHDWSQWLRMILEDVLVIDAPAIYLRPTRGGDLWGLEPIDGATITPLIDAGGRTPLPPSPAYSQILKGIPATDYGYNELIYYPKNPRTNRLYGSSPVQWIVDTIETSIRRGQSQLAYFTAGNINDGIFTGPPEWGIDQIKQWQRYWDDLFEGNLEMRRHGKWVPGGTTFEEIKAPALKDEFDEWLARVICFAYSTSPAPFIKAQNRSNQEGQQEVAEEGGIKPYLLYLKRLMDRILREAFFMPHLEFVWERDEEFDLAEAAKIDDLALGKAAITIDEWRDKRGYKALPDGLGAKPIVFAAGGAQLLSEALKPPVVPTGGDGAGLGEAGGEPAPTKPGSPESLTKRSSPKPRRVNPADPERELIQRARDHMARVVAEALAKARDKVLAELEPKLVDAMNKAAAGLYVRRDLTVESAERLAAWAISQGIANVTPTSEMHATLVFSRDPVDLFAKGGTITAAGGARTVERLGDMGAVVLKFESDRLRTRWQEARDLGASWDYPSYQPHITISYDAGAIDLAAVEPFTDALVFGPELHEPLNESWATEMGLRKGNDPSDEADDVDLSAITALGTEVAPILEGVAADSGEDFLVQIGGVADDEQIVNRVNARAVRFAQNRAAELVGKKLVGGELVDSPTAGITETTRELLRGTITKGLADNIGSRGILDEILASFAFSEERARMIAHTEINRANSQGSLEAAREAEDAGVVLQKVWLLGQNPCDECLDNADEGAIDLDDDFQSGDDAPPAHPNCYCSLSYEVGE